MKTSTKLTLTSHERGFKIDNNTYIFLTTFLRDRVETFVLRHFADEQQTKRKHHASRNGIPKYSQRPKKKNAKQTRSNVKAGRVFINTPSPLALKKNPGHAPG